MQKLFLMLVTITMIHTFAYSQEIEKLVILGGGPAGLTSSLFAAQAHLKPLVIEGDSYKGQITSIYKIENYPGFPEGISGKDLAERIKQQAEIFGARFDKNEAIAVDLSQSPFKISLNDGQEIYCESLVIATGAAPKWLGLESEAALIGHGVSASAVLDAEKYQDKEVVVVGGGDSAMEQALLLTEYASKVTIIYKGGNLYGASYLQERVYSNSKIEFCLNTEVLDILDAGTGEVKGIALLNLVNQKEDFLFCEGVFISNGRKPNTDLFVDQLEINAKGYIVTKPDSSKTSVPGVFAAGDITQAAYRKVTTAVASGCISAIDAAKFLADQDLKNP